MTSAVTNAFSAVGPEFLEGKSRVDIHKSHLEALFASSAAPVLPPYLNLEDSGPRTVVFFNSIGGLGDSIPILLAMQLYKKYHPADTTLLYDSMHLDRHYDLSDFADIVIPAEKHLMTSYATSMVRDMDPQIPRDYGFPVHYLAKFNVTHFVSTHHAHNHALRFEENVIKMDFATFLVDAILQGLMPFRLKLKSRWQRRAEKLIRAFRSDGRPLIGIQNRAFNPYKTHHIEKEECKAEISRLAAHFVEKFNARIVLCGDVQMDFCDHHRKVDWIELNAVEGNTYVKLEVLSQCDYLLGAASGFSLISNLMRTPQQAPGLLMHSTFDLLESREFQRHYLNYVQAGGGVNSAKVPWAYQHPMQTDFLLDMPHTNEKIAKAIECLVRERTEDFEKRGGPVSRWRVPSQSP